MLQTPDTSTTVPALKQLSDGLDEIIERAYDLAGVVTQGSLHALAAAAEALHSDASATHAVITAHRIASMLAEGHDIGHDIRDAFCFTTLAEAADAGDEAADAGDTLGALAHDLDVLRVTADSLTARGLLSSSTRAQLDYAGHLLQRDLEAENTPTVMASEPPLAIETAHPELWPAANRICIRRFGCSLHTLTAKDPALVQSLLYEANANRRKYGRR